MARTKKVSKFAHLTVEELVKSAKDCQRRWTVVTKTKNMNENRFKAVLAGYSGYETSLEDTERKKKFDEADEVIKAALKLPDGEIPEGLPEGFDPTVFAIHINTIRQFRVYRDFLDEELEEIGKCFPLTDWLKHSDQRGIAAKSVAKIIGETGDPRNYSTVAKFWRRMGCAPFTSKGRTQMGSTWKKTKNGLSAEEWVAFGYSPRRRSIVWNIGENIVKQNGPENEEAIARKTAAGKKAHTLGGPYWERYRAVKDQALSNRPEWTQCQKCKGTRVTDKGYRCDSCKEEGEVKKARVNNHAKLLATKEFLKQLWIVWHKATNGEAPAHNKFWETASV